MDPSKLHKLPFLGFGFFLGTVHNVCKFARKAKIKFTILLFTGLDGVKAMKVEFIITLCVVRKFKTGISL